MKSFTITDAVALMLLIHQHKIISAMILNLTSIFKKSYEIKKGGGEKGNNLIEEKRVALSNIFFLINHNSFILHLF